MKTLIQENPTLKKIELFQSYTEKRKNLDEIVDKIYEIDNPPPSKLSKLIVAIFSILFASILSSARKDRN